MALKVIQFSPKSCFEGIAGETILEGQLVGCSTGTTTNFYLADSDATLDGTHANQAIGVAVANAASGDALAVAPVCMVENSAVSSQAAGDLLYLGATAGLPVRAAPTGTTNIQAVGIALTATKIAYNIAPTALKLQASGNSTVAYI